jgi:transcription elongation factor Elf1
MLTQINNKTELINLILNSTSNKIIFYFECPNCNQEQSSAVLDLSEVSSFIIEENEAYNIFHTCENCGVGERSLYLENIFSIDFI